MIKLIKDGALPHPAKCCTCGYSGNERFYYWFKYREKWGQVLICTTCMKEAATLDESFIPQDEYADIVKKNHELRAENDRLELASERFTDAFAGLVTNFLADISGALPPDADISAVEVPEPEVEQPADSPVEPVVEDGIVAVESDFNAHDYVPESSEFPDADLKSIFE